MGFFERLRHGLAKTKSFFAKQLDALFSAFTKIDEDFMDELEEILYTADLGSATTEDILTKLRTQIKEQRLTDTAEIRSLLQSLLAEAIGEGEPLKLDTKPSVILIIGVNGVGKTTSIAKLARHLKSEKKKVILAAADTFRAAAIDQLQVWADRIGVDMIRQDAGSDPAAVVYDAIAAAKSRGADVLIVDTAGRLHNKKNLMDELAKINRVIDKALPEAARETLLVLDATTGQNAVLQAKEFKNAAAITGLIVTKLDGTAKGGMIFSIRRELGVPVKFIGVGEQPDDLQPFDAQAFVEALFE